MDTAAEYGKGLASYYELVVISHGKVLSVCLARNERTDGSSNPFISAIEVMFLDNTLYKSVDLHKYVLSTVARHTFGNDDKNGDEADFIRYIYCQFYHCKILCFGFVFHFVNQG